MRNLVHGGACAECTTNCRLVHQNRKDPLSSVDRFLKLMSGKDFSEVMLLPSNIARKNKWHKYINREACLEDTTGEKYPVKISEVENAVAFKEGWCRFSSEHHLEEGDSVVFNHFRQVKKLHFIVHIYGKSGAEKVFFPRGDDKKVATMNGNATLLNETLDTDTTSSGRKKSSSASVVIPKPLCNEIHHHLTATNNIHDEYTDGKMLQLDPSPSDMEPLYVLDRDVQLIDDKTFLFDLPSFEKSEEHTVPAEVNISNDEAATINQAEKIIESETDSDLLDTFPVKRKFSSPEPQSCKKQNPVTENTIESVQVNISPETKMAVSDGERSSTHVPQMIVCRDGIGSADNIPVQRDVSISKIPSYKAKLDNKKNIDMPGLARAAQDIRRNVATGEAKQTVKKELDIGDELFDHRQFLRVKKQTVSSKNVRSSSSNVKKDAKIPKTASFCSEDISASFLGRKSSSAVVDDTPYLLLQSQLPSVLLHGKKLQTVYLRAPDRKVLPVIYQQREGVRVLTSGWQQFKSMYNLEAGHRCCIELEDASKRIYRFKVIGK